MSLLKTCSEISALSALQKISGLTSAQEERMIELVESSDPDQIVEAVVAAACIMEHGRPDHFKGIMAQMIREWFEKYDG